MIRSATPTDAAAIAAIYKHYVEHTTITFEEEPVSPEQMAQRMAEVAAASLPWLVAEQEGRVLGYAYAGT
jgi:L-amino acid N-acyltransferase YncA